VIFRLLEASDPRGRLGELGRFLEYWFGPRRPGFGEPAERVRARALPWPLAWFYEFAGRWPPGVPGYTLEGFFYTGAGLHHLYPLHRVKPRPDGRLEFHGEYQGDWSGLTLAAGEDPPVWIEGSWIEENGDDMSGEKFVCSSLSRFLVTHCLMGIVHEDDNSPGPVVMANAPGRSLGPSGPGGQRLVDWFLASPRDSDLLWDAAGCELYYHDGTFFLLEGGILVYRHRHDYVFRAIHPEGIRLLKSRLGHRD
jgi:hypothetical protein